MISKKICSTEVGLLAIYDPDSFSDIDLDQTYGEYFVNDADMLRLMNEGKAVVWGTGGDGTFSITVRVNSDQDLSEEERNLVEMKAENLKLIINSGKVQVDTPENISQGEDGIMNNVPAGNYLVNVYFLFDSKIMDMDELEVSKKLVENPDFDKTGYVVVLKNVASDYAFSPITELPQLG